MVGFAMRKKLLQFQSLLAQHALREAPKPRTQFQPLHSLSLHSPTATASPSSFSSAQIIWNRLAAATAAGGHPRSAAAVAAAARTAASRWLAAAPARGQGSLDLFSLKRRRSWRSGWPSAASAFAQGARWLGSRSADEVVLMLIGANVAVFMLWRMADPDFMSRHFMISVDNFKSGRLHTLLTYAFSHNDGGHLLNNMIGLYFFGRNIATVFGPAFLVKLYVAGALTGAAFFLLEKAFRAPQERSYVGYGSSRSPGHGASAAVNAIILLMVFLYPKRLVYLYFFIPIPAALVGAGLIASDLIRAKEGGSRVSGTGHLGGALVAALVWARLRKGWI